MQKERPGLIGDYPGIFGDSPIDVSLDDTRGFQADANGFKKIEWFDRIPNALAEDGRRIPLLALHHQGRGKVLLKNNFKKLNGNPSAPFIALLSFYLNKSLSMLIQNRK
jgi:hypothetical protein